MGMGWKGKERKCGWELGTEEEAIRMWQKTLISASIWKLGNGNDKEGWMDTGALAFLFLFLPLPGAEREISLQ